MRLTVLGSGSAGNCYLLENDTECLVIDAGISVSEVKKALNFNISKIVGVVSSHVHGDHFTYAEQFEQMGIKVYKPFQNNKPPKFKGNFTIKPFPLEHNVPCYGFYIQHKDMGTLIYATDTEYIKWKFKNVNHFLVEANYDLKFVDRSRINYEHILQGHMSIDTTCDFLKANKSSAMQNVILCHLSAENSQADSFISKAKKVVDCPVYVARKGIQIELSETPF